MPCSTSSTRCVLNQTFGCTFNVPNDTCSDPRSSVWTKGACSGVFTVGNRRVRCRANAQCWTDDPIVHPLPSEPMSKEKVCLVLFTCSRSKLYEANKKDKRFANLNEVYRDRVPRWLAFGMQTFSVDSCANMSTQVGGFSTPGVTPLNFNGSTSHCVWGCPTVREKVSLAYVDRHLPPQCEFVFKITGKYFAPSFGAEFAHVPADADVVVQYDMFSYGKAIPTAYPKSQQSEIYGIRRSLIAELLQGRRGDAELQLRDFTLRRCDRLHRMNRLPLLNFTMRSDWRTLRYLR